jgi:hypothetical protein
MQFWLAEIKEIRARINNVEVLKENDKKLKADLK